MSTSNTSNTKSGWSDNFGSDSSLNRSLWQISWGNGSDFKFAGGALTLTSSAAEGWSNTGFMRPDFNAGSGDGYGVYKATLSLDKGQGAGAAITLWPSDNKWPGAELDLLETGATRSSGYSTVHWKGSNGSNAYAYGSFNVDLTQKTNVAVDWEPGSVTFFVGGREVYRNTSHVPQDAAHGGVNESFGAQVTSAKYGAISSAVNLHLYSASYTPSSGGGNVVAAGAASATVQPAMQFSHGSVTVPLASGASFNEQGSANTLVLPAAGSVTLSGNVLSDSLDLRAAMSASGWHQTADLSNYLSLNPTATGSEVSVHTAAGGSVLALAIDGQHPSLASFEAHALLG